jgi:SNF2 family DNA or RNA helicase
MTSHDAGSHGTSLLRAMLPDRRFPFPKSLYAVEDALRFFIKDRPEATVLDFLRLPRVNLLIADDVGLGKTVEAGLVTRELLLRRRIDFIVITAPPAMTIQWRDELESKLGLSFDIIDRERLFLTATPHNGHSNSFSVTKKAKATQRLRVPVLTMSPELDPFTAAWKRELKRSGHSSLP